MNIKVINISLDGVTGGQFLFLVPDANTLVVTTAYPDTNGSTHWERSQKIIKEIMLNVIEALPKVVH